IWHSPRSPVRVQHASGVWRSTAIAQLRPFVRCRRFGRRGAVSAGQNRGGGTLSWGSPQLDREIMTPTTPAQDLASQWSTARRLYPIYFELAREFAIDVKACPDLEAGVQTPGKDVVQQANQWLEQMDQLVQVHQLRQFLQTSSLVTPERLVSLLQHFLAKPTKTDMIRDKIDFLLGPVFSQGRPPGRGRRRSRPRYLGAALGAGVGTAGIQA